MDDNLPGQNLDPQNPSPNLDGDNPVSAPTISEDNSLPPLPPIEETPPVSDASPVSPISPMPPIPSEIPTPESEAPPPPPKKAPKAGIAVAAALLILVTLPIGIALVKTQTRTNSKAATSPGFSVCDINVSAPSESGCGSPFSDYSISYNITNGSSERRLIEIDEKNCACDEGSGSCQQCRGNRSWVNLTSGQSDSRSVSRGFPKQGCGSVQLDAEISSVWRLDGGNWVQIPDCPGGSIWGLCNSGTTCTEPPTTPIPTAPTTPIPTAPTTPIPTAGPICNYDCDHVACPKGYTCFEKQCRNPSCPPEPSCSCPPPICPTGTDMLTVSPCNTDPPNGQKLYSYGNSRLPTSAFFQGKGAGSDSYFELHEETDCIFGASGRKIRNIDASNPEFSYLEIPQPGDVKTGFMLLKDYASGSIFGPDERLFLCLPKPTASPTLIPIPTVIPTPPSCPVGTSSTARDVCKSSATLNVRYYDKSGLGEIVNAYFMVGKLPNKNPPYFCSIIGNDSCGNGVWREREDITIGSNRYGFIDFAEQLNDIPRPNFEIFIPQNGNVEFGPDHKVYFCVVPTGSPTPPPGVTPTPIAHTCSAIAFSDYSVFFPQCGAEYGTCNFAPGQKIRLYVADDAPSFPCSQSTGWQGRFSINNSAYIYGPANNSIHADRCWHWAAYTIPTSGQFKVVGDVCYDLNPRNGVCEDSEWR